MDIYKFKPAPTGSNFQLPFELTEKSLQQWLKTLEKIPDIKKSEQLLFSIQAIKQEKKFPNSQRLTLLKTIYHSLDIHLQALTIAAQNYTLPLSEKETDAIQYIVWIYTELASALANCATKKASSRPPQALFYSLQALIKAYLYISMVYQQPFPDFWKHNYMLYGLACKQGVQNVEIKQYSSHSNTVNKAFKHLLALYHCGLDQFRPSDILTISSCVEKYTSQMSIISQISDATRQYSSFNLNSDTPPSAFLPAEPNEKGLIQFFSAYEVAKKIYTNAEEEAHGTGILKSIRQSSILQAARSLSMSQKRKFTRFNEISTKYGIIGFKNIIAELAQSSTLDPPEEPQQTTAAKKTQLNLMSRGDEPVNHLKTKIKEGAHQAFLPDKERTHLQQAKIIFEATGDKGQQSIWQDSANSEQLLPTEPQTPELNIYDTSINGYKIIIDTNETIAIKIGDVMGIKNGTSIETGIVRRIIQLTGNKLELGVKLLSLETKLAYISMPAQINKYVWILFLPGIKALHTADSVIFDDSHFHAQKFINLHRNNQEVTPCHLNKLLHLSSAATHKELFYSNISDT